MKKKMVAAAVTCVAVASLIVVLTCFSQDIEARYLYHKMSFNRKNEVKSKGIADKLATKRKGIAICSRHLDVFAGRMYGLCEYVLRNAEDKEYVREHLSRIADSETSISQRIAVDVALWQMFQESDALVDLFSTVQKGSNGPLPIAIEAGRKELAQVFKNKDNIGALFLVPPTEDINLTVEGFRELQNQYFTSGNASELDK